jgi:hypothetical protein
VRLVSVKDCQRAIDWKKDEEGGAPVVPSNAFDIALVHIPGRVAASAGNVDPKFRHCIGDFDYAEHESWVAPGYAEFCRATPPVPPGEHGFAALRRAWSRLSHPKRALFQGFSFRQWRRFAACHGGPLRRFYLASPYRRFFRILPSRRRGQA